MARYKGKSNKRRLLDYFATAVLMVMLAGSAAWLERNNAVVISAPARVVDGDSLELNGQKIRLVGIDAPELSQICKEKQVEYSCGQRAREYLQSLIRGNAAVDCLSEGNDKYGRLLAECFIGKLSLNAEMVTSGWAVSYGDFAWIEREARRENRGLWAGEFDDPSEWRHKNGGLAESQSGAVLRSIWRWAMAWFSSDRNK